MSMETAKLDVVALEELSAYKVIGDEPGLLRYCDATKPAAVTDWSGVYLQASAPHAEGAVGYRWDQQYARAQLVRVRLRGVRVVVAGGGFYADGSIPGAAKAARLRVSLREAVAGVDVPEGVPLVEGLGEQGCCLALPETEFEWEIVAAPALLRRVLAAEEVLKEFKSRHGATSHWRDASTEGEGEGVWSPYDEASRLKEPTPAPSWIP
ncbi:hypothetical protein DIPPA_14629 [Diplonema papillatum]|nr:hypothetical protein DIPPA_14629 [Diplonema papillatum]